MHSYSLNVYAPFYELLCFHMRTEIFEQLTFIIRGSVGVVVVHIVM